MDRTKTCGDCIHADICRKVNGSWFSSGNIAYCTAFNDEKDFVEVVRCRDCKHKTVTSDGMVCECALPTKMMKDYYIYGSTILARVEPDAFCSHGERKDNERKAD